MPPPETLSLAAVVISGLSLLVAIVAARYTRAAHIKRISDEQPIFWTELAGGALGWTLTIHARNRSAANLQCGEIEIRKPSGLLIVRESDLYRSDSEGGFRQKPDLIEQLARQRTAMSLRTGPVGSEPTGGPLRSPGATSFERFKLHAEPSLRARISSSKIKVSIRFTWFLKDAASRKRVEHVNITLSAETKPDAAATKIAT